MVIFLVFLSLTVRKQKKRNTRRKKTWTLICRFPLLVSAHRPQNQFEPVFLPTIAPPHRATERTQREECDHALKTVKRPLESDEKSTLFILTFRKPSSVRFSSLESREKSVRIIPTRLRRKIQQATRNGRATNQSFDANFGPSPAWKSNTHDDQWV